MTYYDYIVKYNIDFYKRNGYMLPKTDFKYDEKHDTWWKQQICRVSRRLNNNGLLFYESFDGLPGLHEKIKNN